jgi:hypothetical protein
MSDDSINNLSVASRVHILEPQWNPYVEDQAIGRVFRMGQEKNVYVIRYITKNTVEEVSYKVPSMDCLGKSNMALVESEYRVSSTVEGANRIKGRISIVGPGSL